MDEQNHIARGAAYLGTGEPRLSVEHPPLVNTLSALPTYLLNIQLPLDIWWEAGEWYHFADNFLWHTNNNPEQIVFLARLPIIGLGMVMASLVFRWADARFGCWGGLLATTFCALDPNILAHERLSTTDIGGTFFIFLAAYAFWKTSQNPAVITTIFSGLALGLAFAAKLSALLFGPLLATIFLLDVRIKRSVNWSQYLLKRIIILLAITSLAFLVVWGSYCFQIGTSTITEFPTPLPTYIHGVLTILDFAGGGRPSYLLGKISTSGWWYYFPVTLAVKTPLATLIGLLVATMMLLRQASRDDLFTLVPPVIYFAVSTTARLNLGYRHLLPMLPFLAVHIGRLPLPSPKDLQSLKIARLAFSLLIASMLIFSNLTIYPHYLTYFNIIGGGPENGWRILADSNIDWGQDLKELKRWMKQNEINQIKLSWFGSAYPEHYDISYEPLPGVGFPSHFELWRNPPFNTNQPEPGLYVISVNNLLGLNLPDPDLYAWFRARPPDDRIGYSLFVYEVQE
jgi:hypothetical protein